MYLEVHASHFLALECHPRLGANTYISIIVYIMLGKPSNPLQALLAFYSNPIIFVSILSD